MIIPAFGTKNDPFHWVDIVDPTGTELEIIAKEYDLHSSSLQDCLDAKHLPKYEMLDNHMFILLRAHDEKAPLSAGTVRELTRKIGIFIGKNYIITLHRKDQVFITQIRNSWVKKLNSTQTDSLPILLSHLVENIFKSYESPINKIQEKLEQFESKIFKDETTPTSIQEKYLYKRKAYVFKQMLKISLDILSKLKIISEHDASVFQDIKECGDGLYFYADSIIENFNSLISLQLSLASHNTNQVVKVLTILSMYFMPLMLITGIYGMNFQHMPELKMKYAYPIVLLIMVLICYVLYLWFKRKNWIK